MEQRDPRDNNIADDIILELAPMEGKTTLTSKGMPDKRLFTGENKLHLFRDTITGLWRLKLDFGTLPQPLMQHFTKLSYAKEAAEQYYGRRNVEITKIID